MLRRLVVYLIALDMLGVAYYGLVDGQRPAKTLPPRLERWKVRELSPRIEKQVTGHVRGRATRPQA